MLEYDPLNDPEFHEEYEDWLAWSLRQDKRRKLSPWLLRMINWIKWTLPRILGKFRR